MNSEGEKLNGYVVASTVFHVAIFAVVVFSPSLFPTNGDSNWGTTTAGAGGINARIVETVSGIPLPAPPVVRENVAANESPGLNKSEPAPPPPPVEDAIPVPSPKAPVKTTPPPKPAKTPPAASKTKAPEPETPTNAVPYGQGGRPD